MPLVDGEGDIRVRAQYALAGVPGAPDVVLVRAGVRQRLLQAAAALPADVFLSVFDGFRPLAVQRHLYEDYWAQVAKTNPHWADAEIAQQVNQFVAPPSADLRCPPPHRTGGAVDVYLVDAGGRDLPMGTAPDEIAPASVTRHFETSPQEPFTANRRRLYWAMAGAGFANYRGEWWHFDYGNQRWANCTGANCAVYGVADAPA